MHVDCTKLCEKSSEINLIFVTFSIFSGLKRENSKYEVDGTPALN